MPSPLKLPPRQWAVVAAPPLPALSAENSELSDRLVAILGALDSRLGAIEQSLITPPQPVDNPTLPPQPAGITLEEV